MCPDTKGIRVNTSFASRSDLFIDGIGGLWSINCSFDTHRFPVEFTRTNLWHVLATIHFFVILRMLIVVIRFQSQFGATYAATKTATMEEGKILERTWNLKGIC